MNKVPESAKVTKPVLSESSAAYGPCSFKLLTGDGVDCFGFLEMGFTWSPALVGIQVHRFKKIYATYGKSHDASKMKTFDEVVSRIKSFFKSKNIMWL